jgi:hypothetical protein
MRYSQVHHDNKSAILLEENSRSSSSKRTRHIDIQYFFLTNQIAENEVSVEYCPTGDLFSDFFTKPLQEALFRKLCNLVMNIDPYANGNGVCRSVLNEGAMEYPEAPGPTQVPCNVHVPA